MKCLQSQLANYILRVLRIAQTDLFYLKLNRVVLSVERLGEELFYRIKSVLRLVFSKTWLSAQSTEFFCFCF